MCGSDGLAVTDGQACRNLGFRVKVDIGFRVMVDMAIQFLIFTISRSGCR